MHNKKMHNKISIRFVQTQASIIQFIFTNITFDPVCAFYFKNEFDLRMIDYLAELRFQEVFQMAIFNVLFLYFALLDEKTKI